MGEPAGMAVVAVAEAHRRPSTEVTVKARRMRPVTTRKLICSKESRAIIPAWPGQADKEEKQKGPRAHLERHHRERRHGAQKDFHYDEVHGKEQRRGGNERNAGIQPRRDSRQRR